MKPLLKCIRIASVEQQKWKKQLHTFLFNYRCTSYTTTGIAPATPLRKYHNKLPQAPQLQKHFTLIYTNISHFIQQLTQKSIKNDRVAERKMKKYADKHRKVCDPKFCIGDQVLVGQRKLHKLST